MSKYDVVFNVLLRLDSENGVDINLNIKQYSEKIGELIQKEFNDFIVAPMGMELVEDDERVRILDKIKYTEWDI